MGGIGSGNYSRYDKKPTMEQQTRLDIHYLKRRGMLNNGYNTIMRWYCGDHETGSIRLSYLNAQVILNYRLLDTKEDIQQNIPLLYSSCHYGNKRPWFSCFQCGKRVGILILAGKYFRCRHCCHVAYQSQQVCKGDRYQLNATKIKERLNIKYDTGSLSRDVYDFDKPKYMKWAKFYRLKNKANQYNKMAVEQWKHHPFFKELGYKLDDD